MSKSPWGDIYHVKLTDEERKTLRDIAKDGRGSLSSRKRIHISLLARMSLSLPRCRRLLLPPKSARKRRLKRPQSANKFVDSVKKHVCILTVSQTTGTRK